MSTTNKRAQHKQMLQAIAQHERIDAYIMQLTGGKPLDEIEYDDLYYEITEQLAEDEAFLISLEDEE